MWWKRYFNIPIGQYRVEPHITRYGLAGEFVDKWVVSNLHNPNLVLIQRDTQEECLEWALSRLWERILSEPNRLVQ